MIANLKHAARNGETVTIGGGQFGPAELLAAAKLLETVPVLTDIILEAERLGLSFDIGTAYIRREYITKQTELRDRITAALRGARG